MKKGSEFHISNTEIFKLQMLNWAQQFNIFCFLDNGHYAFEIPAFECLMAAGAKRKLVTDAGQAFESLRNFYNSKPSWLFGHLSYDLKNELEDLSSGHYDGVRFLDLQFFEPEIVLMLSDGSLKIQGDCNHQAVFEAINNCSSVKKTNQKPVNILPRISKDQYLNIIHQLQQHIHRGDCYEINYCQEFYANQVTIEPVHIYNQLNSISPNPFSALYKWEDKYCMCASPERYLKSISGKLYSQPIKGTVRRDRMNAEQDEANKHYLKSNQKERSENVMVVDLVRNDLSKVCKPGSVKVEELFGVYSFPQVHQMISTVTGEIKEEYSWIDAIKASFPMGSMTGAPKKRVMQLVEQYEQTKRGLFSGSIGYITPSGDFDFNVVIRSILYNASEKYLSYQAGSAITAQSNAEQEYEECLLKGEAIKKVLE